MTSWGDSASEQASADFDSLLSPSLGFAKQQLDTKGEFYPYAVVVDSAGQVRMVGSDIGEERPASADVISSLVGAISAQRDEYRAVALVSDVHLRDKATDAIRVTLEHADGLNFAVVLPYETDELGVSNEYGDLALGRSNASIWTTPSA